MTIAYARRTATHRFHDTHSELIDGDNTRSSGIDAFGSACDGVALLPIVVPGTFDNGGWTCGTEHWVAVSP